MTIATAKFLSSDILLEKHFNLQLKVIYSS